MSDLKLCCQVCRKEFDPEKVEKIGDNAIQRFCPGELYSICSTECQKTAIEINACFRFKDAIRNAGCVDFDRFKEMTGYPEEGGYAEDKWLKFRSHPLLVIMGMDTETLKRFVSKL